MTPEAAYWLGAASYMGRRCPTCRGGWLRQERKGDTSSDLICPCGARVPAEQVVDLGRTIVERDGDVAGASREAGHDPQPQPGRPGPFHAKGSDTSEAAARSMLSSHGRLQERVLECVVRAGAAGITCDEVETGMGLRHQTAAARLRELELAGRVRKTEQRRKTRSGRTATVYRIVPKQVDLFGEAA